MIAWRPSKLALMAWASVAAVIVMQYFRVAPIGNVLATAIFYIGWFISLFVVLPVGVRTQSDEGEIIRGTSAGAPVNARAGRIIALTTIVASAVFAVILLSMHFRLIPLE